MRPAIVILLGVLALTGPFTVVNAAKPGAPNLNTCRGKWVMTLNQPLAFGGFSADGAGSIFMNSTGNRTTNGLIDFSSNPAASAMTLTIDNTKSSDCGVHGITLSWNPAPASLTGPGSTMSVSNLRLSGPAISPPTSLPVTLYPASLPQTFTVSGDLAVNYPQGDGDYTSSAFAVDLTQDTITTSLASTASATSYISLSVSESTALNFGTLASGAVPGTITVSPSAGVSTSGGTQAIPATGAGSALFTITGSSGSLAISVALSATGSQLDDAGSGIPMSLTALTNNGLPSDTGTGTVGFSLGATLNVGANQTAGLYSTAIGGGVPYLVTVSYN